MAPAAGPPGRPSAPDPEHVAAGPRDRPHAGPRAGRRRPRADHVVDDDPLLGARLAHMPRPPRRCRCRPPRAPPRRAAPRAMPARGDRLVGGLSSACTAAARRPRPGCSGRRGRGAASRSRRSSTAASVFVAPPSTPITKRASSASPRPSARELEPDAPPAARTSGSRLRREPRRGGVTSRSSRVHAVRIDRHAGRTR